jgi:hypothetical protein
MYYFFLWKKCVPKAKKDEQNILKITITDARIISNSEEKKYRIKIK